MTHNKLSKDHALTRLAPVWALLVLLACMGWASAQSPAGLVPVPPLTGHIVDQTQTFKPDQRAMLEQQLREFESRKGSQLAVLLVPDTQPETIEQFALRVAEQWKIGRKNIDDGAILVIAKNERALRIEVGYGLEGALNDATAKRIVEERIVPRFKEGDFYGGAVAGVETMMRVIEGEPLPAPSVAAEASDRGVALLPVLFFAALMVGGIARALMGRLKGALLTGGVLGVAAWLLAGVVGIGVLAAVAGFVLTLAGGRMGGGWHGRAGHYGGYGGSSRGGGFRGGGGGFGGGGASGRW